MRTPAYTWRMERSGWVRRVTLLQFAIILAILALVTMHTPAPSQAMPPGHDTRETMSANHVNGSACRTVHEKAATTPAATEHHEFARIVSAEPPARPDDHSFHPVDQTTLSIWRT